MNALDIVPIRTFVTERQTLIAKALHVFLDASALVRVVGDATTVNIEDFKRTQPDLVAFGRDNATHDVADALALVRGVCRTFVFVSFRASRIPVSCAGA